MSSTPSTGGRHRVQLCSSGDTPSVGSASASRARLVCCASRSSLILALTRMTAVGRRSVVTISHLGVSILQYLAVATDKANSRRSRTPPGRAPPSKCKKSVTLRPGASSTCRERRECRLSEPNMGESDADDYFNSSHDPWRSGHRAGNGGHRHVPHDKRPRRHEAAVERRPTRLQDAPPDPHPPRMAGRRSWRASLGSFRFASANLTLRSGPQDRVSKGGRRYSRPMLRDARCARSSA